MTQTVQVIGGGPAGMAAAFFAAKAGAVVCLRERNEKLGKKLYITGKGRCNVTNTAENPLAHIPRNARFLHSAFSFMNADDLRALLFELGCPTIVERGGRVFPQSEKASDVTRAFERALYAIGVQVMMNCRVMELEPLLKDGPVILATGGASYPSTGSTGDGYQMVGEIGHHVFPPQPSLIPLETADEWPKALAGVSLKNVTLSAKLEKKVRFEELGEMLFTHFGISGPLVLSMSSHITDDDLSKLDVRIDLKPGLTAEQVEKRLVREFTDTKKQVGTLMPRLVPQAVSEVVMRLCDVDAKKTAGQVTRQERFKLSTCLKGLPIKLSRFRPLEEAIITRGGIDIKEVDPKTMMSKRLPGLFFAGELLDVDARTGGFNLQIAFSTGALAGASAANWAMRTNQS